MPGPEKDVVVVNSAANPIPTAAQGVSEVRVVNQPETPQRTPVVLQSSSAPAGFVEVRPDGTIRMPGSPEEVVPAGMKLVVQDVEWFYRGPAAYAGKRVLVRIHLGPTGQGTWSFLSTALLDADASGSAAHYTHAGFVVHHGEAISPFTFVYPNNQAGSGELWMTLRGYFTSV